MRVGIIGGHVLLLGMSYWGMVVMSHENMCYGRTCVVEVGMSFRSVQKQPFLFALRHAFQEFIIFFEYFSWVCRFIHVVFWLT